MDKAELALELTKLISGSIQLAFGRTGNSADVAKLKAELVTEVYNKIYENLACTTDKD